MKSVLFCWRFTPPMCIICGLSRYFSSIAAQKVKNEGSGKSSSSRMMPSSTFPKNQSKAPAGPYLQPKFSSRNSVRTSHGQSTAVAIFCVSSQSALSVGRFGRGPSPATKSLAGRRFRISSNTRPVLSGRLKIRSSIGVVNCS